MPFAWHPYSIRNSPSPARLHRIDPSSCCHPRGDGGAPTGAYSLFSCRAGQARRAPCDRCARLSALRRDGFGPGKPRARVPALPPAPSRGLAAGALIEPRRRHPTSRTALRPGRHARSVCRIVSGDAPHRAGCVTHTPDPIRSQYKYTCRSRKKRPQLRPSPATTNRRLGEPLTSTARRQRQGGSQVSFRIDRRRRANSARRNGLPMTANSSTARCRCSTSSA